MLDLAALLDRCSPGNLAGFTHSWDKAGPALDRTKRPSELWTRPSLNRVRVLPMGCARISPSWDRSGKCHGLEAPLDVAAIVSQCAGQYYDLCKGSE